MIKCPFCQTSHVENTLFCNECGTYLLDDSSPQTDPLLGHELLKAVETPLLSQSSSPIAIQLRIGGQGRRVVLPLKEAINLGRTDAARQIFPDVDLTEHGGSEAGVSRRHARIARRDDQVVIEDLDSTNGTFVNGERLAPYLLEALTDGDFIELGRLRIQVLFEDEEGILQKRPDPGPQARREYLAQRLGDLFELDEGGLCYLEWVPPEDSTPARSITRLIGEMMPLARLGATLIGRYPDASLQLASRKVSGHHCRIFYDDYRFFIEDLASTNGTMLNKTKLIPYTRQELRPGDAIRVGDIPLFFQDRLVAFLGELKSPLDQQIVIEDIKARADRNPETALFILARFLYTWSNAAEAEIVAALVAVIYDLVENTPLKGLGLLLNAVRPDNRYIHHHYYLALGRLLAQEMAHLPDGLVLLVRLAGPSPTALFHWIAQSTLPGPTQTFFEACRNLCSQDEYTRTDLEQLLGNLNYLAEGVAAKSRLDLYQTVLEMLGVKTIANLAVFHSLQLLPEGADPTSTGARGWLQRLVEVAVLAQKVRQTAEAETALKYLAEALQLLDQFEQENSLNTHKLELTIYSEIIFQWRWIMLTEQAARTL